MKIRPRTELDHIESQIRFHEEGARFYTAHGQWPMVKWSKQLVAEWREKLLAVSGKREPGDGE